MSTPEHIKTILLRDLASLRRELEAYTSSEEIWAVPEGITNSAGTLSLHLCGNLQHFLGAILGKSGYQRDRESEFSARAINTDDLLAEIDSTVEAVSTALDNLSHTEMTASYPVPFDQRKLPTERFLIHLCAHLAFHLGQIDYHRRMVTGRNESIAPQRISEL